MACHIAIGGVAWHIAIGGVAWHIEGSGITSADDMFRHFFMAFSLSCSVESCGDIRIATGGRGWVARLLGSGRLIILMG